MPAPSRLPNHHTCAFWRSARVWRHVRTRTMGRDPEYRTKVQTPIMIPPCCLYSVKDHGWSRSPGGGKVGTVPEGFHNSPMALHDLRARGIFLCIGGHTRNALRQPPFRVGISTQARRALKVSRRSGRCWRGRTSASCSGADACLMLVGFAALALACSQVKSRARRVARRRLRAIATPRPLPSPPAAGLRAFLITWFACHLTGDAWRHPRETW